MDRNETKEVLSVSSPEDVLAYLPHVLGYWPQMSLVVLALRGKQLGASLRLDLPGRSASFAEQIRYARGVAEHLRLDRSADGALLTVYAGIDWHDDSDPGYDRLMFCLAQALAAAGLPVREAWWVGEKTWRDYLCRDASCCPFGGWSLKDVRNSSLSAELVYRGSSYEPDLAAAMELPELGPAQRRQSLAAFARLQRGISAAAPDEAELAQALRSWDTALAAEATEAATNTLGYLAAWLCNAHIRDAVLLLALTDRKRAMAKGAAELLLGSTEVNPPWPRLARLEVILRRIVAVHHPDETDPGQTEPDETGLRPAGQESAAAALTGLGWLEWCRGRGSRAGVYLESALALRPGYRLAELFLQLIESGQLCCWAKNETTAWQRNGPSAA